MRRAARTDSTQPECIRAIRLLGLKYKLLSRAGDGIEDILALIPPSRTSANPWWLFVECKVPTRKDGGVKPSRFTKAQKEWRAATPDGPRITVTGFEDTLRKLREMMGI